MTPMEALPTTSDIRVHVIDLRDWFAGKALEGWLASYAADSRHPAELDAPCAATASLAYKMADAMLAARGGGRE